MGVHFPAAQLSQTLIGCVVSDQQLYHFCFGETENCLRGLPTRCVLGKSNEEFNCVTCMCEWWVLPIPLFFSARLPQAEFTPKGDVCVFHSSNTQTGRSKWLLKALVQHTGSGVSLYTAHVRAFPSVSFLLVKTPRLWVTCLHQWCEGEEQTERENTAFNKEVKSHQAFQLLILPIPARQIK